MRERGIAIPAKLLETKAKQEVVPIREYVEKVRASRAPVALPEPECPCKQQGLLSGRHKLEDGSWCVDGLHWTAHEIFKMRTLEFNSKTEEGYKSMVNALTLLKRHAHAEVNEIFIVTP